jgi:hypothetical protein
MREESKIGVGPVLMAGPVAQAVILAIRELSPAVSVLDRGSYVRVSAPGRCLLDRSLLEKHLGRAFLLPGDLEAVMPAFRGRLTIDERRACWEAFGEVAG